MQTQNSAQNANSRKNRICTIPLPKREIGNLRKSRNPLPKPGIRENTFSSPGGPRWGSFNKYIKRLGSRSPFWHEMTVWNTIKCSFSGTPKMKVEKFVKFHSLRHWFPTYPFFEFWEANLENRHILAQGCA